MWPFKRKKESPQEIAAEKKLDEVTREVALQELDKEAVREQQAGFSGRSRWGSGAKRPTLCTA